MIYSLNSCCGWKPKVAYYCNGSQEMWEVYCAKCGKSVTTTSPSRTVKEWNQNKL